MVWKTQGTRGEIRPSKCFWQIVWFDWYNRKCFDMQRTDTRVTKATVMYGTTSPVELFNQAVINKSLEVWQAPNGTMQEQTKVLVEKASNWIRKLCRNLYQTLYGQEILKCRIWSSMAYVLPTETLYLAQVNRIGKSDVPICTDILSNHSQLTHYFLISTN